MLEKPLYFLSTFSCLIDLFFLEVAACVLENQSFSKLYVYVELGAGEKNTAV